jgi:hypothetical protein
MDIMSKQELMSKGLNKNAALLGEFTAYCVAHPEERFWQALRNWSGYEKVLVQSDRYDEPDDTFYFIRKAYR